MSDLPSTWSESNLLNLAVPVRGVTYKKEQVRSESALGFIPILRANNLTAEGFAIDDLVYVPNNVVSENQHIKAGDIIIAMSSGSISVVGKTVQAKTNMPFSFGAFCGALRPITEIDYRYLGYFFRTEKYRSAVSMMAKGSNINNLKWSHFEQIEMPIAPLNEQKRIADKLDTLLAAVDACRGRLDKVPALIKRFRQSVLAAATSGALTGDWREALASSTEWVETQIQEIASVGTGSTPLRTNDLFFTNGTIPWITSAATSQELVTKADTFVTDAAVTAHRLKRYEIGTLLVAMYGEGKTRGQVCELGIAATINQACAAVKVDVSKALTKYVKFSLQSNYLQMRAMAEGGNQPNLNLSKVKEFPIHLPPMEEQTEIVRRVEALFTIADKLEARLATARKRVDQLTPAILAKAFRGELVPQDPCDEPVSVLLEKIANPVAVKRPIKKAA